jgi:hypothetical protein
MLSVRLLFSRQNGPFTDLQGFSFDDKRSAGDAEHIYEFTWKRGIL